MRSKRRCMPGVEHAKLGRDKNQMKIETLQGGKKKKKKLFIQTKEVILQAAIRWFEAGIVRRRVSFSMFQMLLCSN